VSQSAILGETEIRLDGDLSELPRLAEAVACFCRSNSLGAGMELNLNLVLEELFANVVAHGGCKGMKDAVAVRLARTGDGIALEFTDRGSPFDPADAPLPDLAAPLAERQFGGLGLHFVRSLARISAYRREDGWNRLDLRLAMEPV
jgi:anti-sigma regulatory factor (Ser/Thr protein kinase)